MPFFILCEKDDATIFDTMFFLKIKMHNSLKCFMNSYFNFIYLLEMDWNHLCFMMWLGRCSINVEKSFLRNWKKLLPIQFSFSKMFMLLTNPFLWKVLSSVNIKLYSLQQICFYQLVVQLVVHGKRGIC